VHWLQYDDIRCPPKKQEKQLADIRQYLRSYPEAKAEGYWKTTGDMFAKFVRLECEQSYNDLDLACNSFFDNCLRRHHRKPTNIEVSKKLTEELNEGIRPNQREQEAQYLKLVYVCSPVRGDIETNLEKANRYCEYVAGCGHIPIAPHLAWQGFLPESPENREKALVMGLKLLEYCSEVWCCGDEISQGMQGEIEAADKLGKPVMYILQERIDENLKIRQNLEPLGHGDCVPGSDTHDYDNKILVIDPETQIKNCRNAQNSLWVAYGGFGCTYGARGQAVNAKNLFDGRETQWERADFLGVVKPESLQKWLDDMPVRSEAARSYAQTAAHEQDDGIEV